MAFIVKGFSDRRKTGNVTAVKYKRIRYKGIVCDRCGVEVTKSKVRRERMGHIELAAPVSHIWYFKGIPTQNGPYSRTFPREISKECSILRRISSPIRVRDTNLAYKEILTEAQYREARDTYGDSFKAGMGAEAVRELLTQIDLEQLSADLREKLKDASGQKKNQDRQTS